MPYLIFSGMEYEGQGGMCDFECLIKTKEELLAWAQANLPQAPHHWLDIAEITEDGCYDIDEAELLEGRLVREQRR